jgi:hypothetical protein
MKEESIIHCHWPSNDLAQRYHDKEWGIPVHEDHKGYEFVVLDGAQAGLGWDTVFRRRENYPIIEAVAIPEGTQDSGLPSCLFQVSWLMPRSEFMLLRPVAISG